MKKLILSVLLIVLSISAMAQLDSIARNWEKNPLFEVRKKTPTTLIVSSEAVKIEYRVEPKKITIITTNLLSNSCIIETLLIF